MPKKRRAKAAPRRKNPLGLEYGARVHVQAKDQTGRSVRGVCTVLGQANEKHLVVQGHDGKVWIVARSACRKANGEPSIDEAKRRYESFHWGDPAKHVAKVRVPSAAGHALVELGEMTAVAYKTNKAGKVEEYEHKFKKPRPVLAMDEEENLLVVGGGYKVEDRGIVD